MSRRRWWTAGVLAAIVVLATSGSVAWYARAGLVRWLVVRQLSDTTNRRATIERLDIDLMRGHLAIEGLRLASLEPGPPLAELDRLDVRFDPRALLRGSIQIHEAALVGGRLRIVRSERGEFSIADLLGGGRAREGSRAVTVDRLTLTDGIVSLEDRTRTPVHTWRVEHIAMEVTGVSPQNPDTQGSGRLTATIDGAPISAEISGLRLVPLQLSGRLIAKDVDATLAGIYLPAGVAAVLDRARITAEVTARVDPKDGVRLDANGRLDDLALRNRRTGDPLVTVPSLAFTVGGASLDASERPRLGRVEVTGAATLFDAQGSSAGRLEIDPLRLRIEDDSGTIPPSARVSFTAGLPDGGGLEVQGPLRLAPIGAELWVRVTRVNPTVLASYADAPVRLAGLVDGDLTVDLSYPGALAARVRGRATVSRAAVAGGSQQVAVARQVDIDGVDAQWPRIGIARIRVVQPVAVVERDRTGHVPVAAFLAAPRAAIGDAAGAKVGEAAPSNVTVEIGEVAVDDGTVTLDDATAIPPARLTFARMRVSARNVTWPARGPATIDVQVATPGAGTLEAKGSVSLDTLRLDVRARLAGAALAPYQGYVPFSARIQGQASADLAVAGSLAPRADITARGTAAVSDLAMAEGDTRVLSLRRLETTGLEYTWPATLNVDRLHVQGSRVRVVRQADGTFPLRALFAPARTERPDPARSSGAAPPAISVTVREAILEDGRARIVDEAVRPAARIDLSGVRLVAQGFTWPARNPFPIELRIGTPGGGSAIARGALDLAGAGADLNVVLSGIDLSPAQPYLPGPGRITGMAGADLDVKGRLSPLSIAARGTAALANVAIAEGEKPVITAARLEATGLDYAWPAKVAIDRIRVQTPRAVIERRLDGAFPLAALLTRSDGTSSPSTPAAARPGPASPDGATPPPLEVSIRESVLEDGSATMTDATLNPAARFEVTGMRLVARNVTWPSRGPTPLELRASTPGGGTINATGQLGQALAGLDLDVALTGVDVATARPYLPLRGRIAGKASARLAINATIEPLAITARGTASLADLAVVDGERPLLTAERSEISGLDYAWPATVSIDQLRVQKPWALIDRVSGTLPVLDALPVARPPDGAVPNREPAGRGDPRPGLTASTAERRPGASEARAPLQLSVRRGVIENGAATIVDSATRPPARLEITGASLVVNDLTWPARGPTGVMLRATLPGAGALEASGQLRLDVSTIDTKMALARVDLATFQPLVPVRARIGGKASADLQIKGTLIPLALTATGQVAVSEASLGDGQRSLVTAKRLDLAGLTAEWPRRRATIQRIAAVEPWALVERDSRGELPLLALLTPEPRDGAATATAARAAGPAENAPRIEVGTFVVENGFVRFTDRTTTPAFVEEASRLAVTARGLGTEPSTRSEIAVSARLTEGAQLEVHGLMGPLGGPLFADAQGKLSGLPLNRVNPYVNGLLGWIARRGSLSATSQFRIRDDRLEADNEIVIGQPQFAPSRSGDEVRKRVGVPLDLLVSLLENARREVRLSVPVTGTISSREFDFGDAVWEAIRKAAINVLALPVSWVGKIFYTADARIDTIVIWPVYFDPGTTRMRRGFDAHAERLATFMRQTPAIIYTLKPVMTVEDINALKRDAVRQRLEALAREAGQPDTATAAARLFAERFPGRPVPAELDLTLDELARDEPSPDDALRALATSRLALTRTGLETKGVDGARLRTSDGAVPVEASGAGRVEFEMIPDAAETPS